MYYNSYANRGKRSYVNKRGRGRGYRRNYRNNNIYNRIQALERISAPEKKYKDVANNTQSISSTPTLVLLNGMTTGDTAITREGQSITMLYSYLQFDAIVSAAALGSVVRMMIVYDNQSNGAAFAAADLLSVPTNLESAFLIGYSHRFTVLWDYRFALSTVGSNYQVIRKKFKRCSLKTQYNTTNGGTIADITTGSLYLLYMSDEPVNVPVLSYYHRLRFAG